MYIHCRSKVYKAYTPSKILCEFYGPLNLIERYETALESDLIGLKNIPIFKVNMAPSLFRKCKNMSYNTTNDIPSLAIINCKEHLLLLQYVSVVHKYKTIKNI
jgi:hypothetical protein